MILDSGICSVYKIQNTAEPGEMPREHLVKISDYWFGELSFESSPSQYTDSLEQVEIARRIRILQDRRIEQKVIVMIDGDQYRVERVFHGQDAVVPYFTRGAINDGTGEMITDMSLSRVVSAYDLG